jgi:hypothetical protein
MNFFGLSPAAFAIGALVAAGALAVLHLLRVRLRRQEVDTLLFFRAAAAVQRPRSLLAKFSRPLAYLFGLLLLLTAWTAFADPRGADDGTSRAIVVDASGASAGRAADGTALFPQLIAKARELAATSGPRGLVVAAAPGVPVLWRSGEPLALLDERAAALTPSGPGADLGRATRTARGLLGVGDDVVVLDAGSIANAPAAAGIARIERDDAIGDRPGSLRAEIVGATAGRTVALWLDGERATNTAAAVQVAAAQVAFDVPATARSLELRLIDGATTLHAVTVPLPTANAIEVDVGDDVPTSVVLAVRADPTFVEADTATLRIRTNADDTTSPTLVVTAGVDPRARRPERTDRCLFPLSLHDRSGIVGGALATPPGGFREVFVRDAATGAPLIALDGAHPSARIHVVDWLVDGTHRDVPTLVAAALRHLAGRPAQVERAIGEPLGALAAGDVDAAGFAPFGPAALRIPGDARRTLHAYASVAPTPAATPFVMPPSLGGDGRWLPWLLAFALLLVLADQWLHHRGRMP